MIIPAVEEYDITGIGPYAPGQENKFKMDMIRRWAEDTDKARTYFCIETESTEPGFPDVLILSRYGGAYSLFEFKVSDERGVITFKKSQPLFYKKHADLYIRIIAWDVPGNRAVVIQPSSVVRSKTLKIKLPEAK
jgi:hypothetical protein